MKYLSGLPQNHIFQGLTFVNPAADWRTVVRIFVVFALALQSIPVLYDVINYNNVTSALSSYEYGKNITFARV